MSKTALADITFHVGDAALTASELNDLYEAVHWNLNDIRTDEQTEAIIRSSLAFVTARYGGELVGFGRLLGDAYIVQVVDVITAPDFQRRGIGQEIMRKLLENIPPGVVGVSLVDGSGYPEFYEAAGFEHADPDTNRLMYLRHDLVPKDPAEEPSVPAFERLSPGDKVAVLSPSFAAPGFAPAIHEQALERIRSVLGLEPVEYPTTRQLGASPEARAADLHAAYADPEIRAIFATIGGNDQITVTPHLNEKLIKEHPKPYFGYSDNTNILNWLWQRGLPGYYGGSTQVHLGAGPAVDPEYVQGLRAALFAGGTVELTRPKDSQDFGPDWLLPEALTQTGDRELTEPWHWAGPTRVVSGKTWGGCLEVIDQLAMADRLPSNAQVAGGILLIETSERLTPPPAVHDWLRGLGERGMLEQFVGVMVARPVTSSHANIPSAAERKAARDAQRDVVLEIFAEYNPEAVVCIGVPFGHSRPQWIVPYGGIITLDGETERVFAEY